MPTLPPPAERRRLIQDAVEPWRRRALHDVLDDAVQRFGHRPLVLAEEVTYTYDEAREYSLHLASGLARLGIGRGDRVALVLANYAEYVPLKVAVSRLGAVAVPLNYLYRKQELQYVLRQSRANFLVTMTGFLDLDYPAMLDEVAPGWEQGSSAALPDLRGVVLFENLKVNASRVAPTLEDVAESGRSHPCKEYPRVSGDDIGDIVYTSGTTGLPKGVMVTQDAYLRSSYATALTRAFEDGRRLIFAAPLFHMFSYVEAFLPCLWVGGAVIPLRTFSPPAFLDAVDRYQATEILAVALIEEAERSTYPLDSLNAILSGAAPAPLWVWEKCRTVLGASEVTTGYGMTESGAGLTMTRPEDPLELVSRTVGRIKLAGTSGHPDDPGRLAVIRTVDPTTGETLPDGTEGELIVKAPTLMTGFWEKPKETRAVFDGTWLRTGDVGVVEADGVRLTGRTKELYKSGGELVMPREVEEVIVELPEVSQAFVVGLPDERWGEIGCAVVVPSPDADVDPQTVLDHCRRRLARFKVPKQVVVRSPASLPMTLSGKVRKVALVQELAAARAAEQMMIP